MNLVITILQQNAGTSDEQSQFYLPAGRRVLVQRTNERQIRDKIPMLSYKEWKEKGGCSIQLFHKLTLGLPTLEVLLPTYSLPVHVFFLQFVNFFPEKIMTHMI